MNPIILDLLINKKVFLWGNMKYNTLKNFARMYNVFKTDYLFRKDLDLLISNNKMIKYKLKKSYYFIFLNIYEKEKDAIAGELIF